jgi:class 3 adenylate cyclase
VPGLHSRTTATGARSSMINTALKGPSVSKPGTRALTIRRQPGRLPRARRPTYPAAGAPARRSPLLVADVLGYGIIGAAGFTPDDPTAVSRIANLAVACRDGLIALIEENGVEPYFRLGIDYGNAIGRSVGDHPSVFNLWGGAVRGAQIMAASALPATIQATQAAYLRLRLGFLLRPRGTFYMPPAGTTQTFTLAGRLEAMGRARYLSRNSTMKAPTE